MSVLALEGLEKSFGALRATAGVSLTVQPGEIHALIGPNGAGKSTLIGLVAGTLRPDRGRVLLGGADVTALSVAARARLGLGRTFQVSSLAMPLSARRNVMPACFGSPWGVLSAVRRDPAVTGPAEAALARVGLSGREGVAAAALSHGERRLVEIAAALALRPRLLLLDEPMAGLGPEAAAALAGLLLALKAETPILLVEHDMDVVFRVADRISVLVAGRIIASGTPEAIRADPGVQAAYLGEAA